MSSLLILLGTGCRKEHNESGGIGIDTPEPDFDIDKEKLLGLISNSERPFVLVNFFATWCRPCKEELPDLVSLHNDKAKEVDVVLISVDKPDDAKSKLHNFLNDQNVNFQTYARTRNESAFIKDFYPKFDGNIPVTLLYDNKGKQLEVFKGMTDRQEIELVINRYKITGGNP